MAIENAYHKLTDPTHFEAIQREGLRPSTPAERHWLGKGVYFFLDPVGFDWAKRWPCQRNNPRTNSSDGIIFTTVDTTNALDLRDLEIMRTTRSLVNIIKLGIRFKTKKTAIGDGEAFAALFGEHGIFKAEVELDLTAIIANFDRTYEKYRLADSRAFLDDRLNAMPITSTAQIQACVRDNSAIGELSLEKS